MEYDRYWVHVRRVAAPTRSSLWPFLKAYVRDGERRLELGSGMRPKFPFRGTVFLDMSRAAVAALRAAGAEAVVHDLRGALPFPDGYFHAAAAFEVLEHLSDDRAVLREIARALEEDGMLFLSVPAHMRYWSAWDAFVGHERRYDPREIRTVLEENGFRIEQFFGFATLAHRIQKTAAYRACAALSVAIAKAAPRLFATAIYDFGFRLSSRCLSSGLRKQEGFVCWNGEGEFDVANLLIVCRKTSSAG